MAPGADDASLGLRSVLRLTADILQVREIEAGQSVGYGASFIAPHKMRLATLGIGYADGFLRRYHCHIAPVVNGVPCPIIGRISMDSCVIDISAIDPHQGLDKTALLFHSQFSPKDLASSCDTIAYEIITALGERVLRHYDDDAPSL